MSPELPRAAIHLSRLQLKRHRLIRLRRHQQILEILISRHLHALLKRTHESVAWLYLCANLRILQLKQQPELSRDGIAELRYFVPGPSDLDEVFSRRDELLSNHALWETCYGVEIAAFFGFARGATGEVGLVLAALGVCEVGAVILVHGETETAFEGADVVLEAVGAC